MCGAVGGGPAEGRAGGDESAHRGPSSSGGAQRSGQSGGLGRDRSDGEGRSGGRRSCGLLHQRAEAAEQPHHHAAEVSALPADRDAPQRVSV